MFQAIFNNDFVLIIKIKSLFLLRHSLMNIEYCFFHIEKCMGSSLRKMLINYFKKIYPIKLIYEPAMCNKYLIKAIKHNRLKNTYIDINLTNEEDRLKLNNIGLNKIKVFLAHCNYDHPNVTSDFSKKCFSITCVREPYSRFISNYYFFKYKIYKKYIHELSENDLNALLEYYANIMTYRLAGGENNYSKAIDNLQHINCIIIMERINTDLPLLNNCLNMRTKKNIPLNICYENKINNDFDKNKDLGFLKTKSSYFENDIKLYEFITSMNDSDRFKLN